MTEEPVALFKLGEKPHMTRLFREGHVFMNTMAYFAKLEDGSPRYDSAEGTGYSKNVDGYTFQMQVGDEWRTLGTAKSSLLFRDPALATVNLYCLHAKTERDYGAIVTLSDLGFGDTFVLFIDFGEFLRRLQKAVAEKEKEQQVGWGMVDYVKRNSYTGPMGIFRKFSEHAAEREFRIAVSPGLGHPLSLHLGDLSDIAIMGPANRRVRLDRNA